MRIAASTAYRMGPQRFFRLVIHPQFADDLQGEQPIPSDENGDWSILDNVPAKQVIMDLFGNQNVIKRKDKTCKLIYSTIGKLQARYIFTDEIYAAFEDCVEEFYQGCFEDYSNEDWNVFEQQIMPLIEKAVGADIYSNKYFGDVTRTPDPAGKWSWNKFDGVFTHIAKYIDDGTIPSGQTMGITTAGSEITPAEANDVLDDVVTAQDYTMSELDDDEKVIYVNKKIAKAYHKYLVASGVSSLQERQDGLPPRLFKDGIEIKPKKWDGLLNALNGGSPAHAAILTIRGNFLYGTDRGWGWGPNRNEAVRVWYDDRDFVWRRGVWFKAGTEIAAPQFIVIAKTDF